MTESAAIGAQPFVARIRSGHTRRGRVRIYREPLIQSANHLFLGELHIGPTIESVLPPD